MLSKDSIRELNLDKRLLEENYVEVLKKNKEYRGALVDIRDAIEDYLTENTGLITMISKIDDIVNESLK